MVCELCTYRAANEGWLREAEGHPASLGTPRGQRGRTFLDRLRQLREPPQRTTPPHGPADVYPAVDREPEPYDFLGSSSTGANEESFGVLEGPVAPGAGDREPVEAWRAVRTAVEDTPTHDELKIARALEVFNAGMHQRRVAGVARSLGEPSVTARPAAESSSCVSIVVAWELCWYRYEVDLGDEAAGVRVVAEGTQLDELPEEDLLANVLADDGGELALPNR